MSERNYDNTGAKERALFTFVEINSKKALFEIGNEEPGFPSFAGYVKDFFIAWEPAPKHVDIPPHWKYRFVLEAKAKDGSIKDFAITLCSFWQNSMFPDIINTFAGALATEWDRGIKFNLWLPKTTTASGRTMCKAKIRTLDDKDLPTKFKWDDVNKGFIGVPKAIENQDGTLSFKNVMEFYHGVANECASYFGHPAASKESGTNHATSTTPPPATQTNAAGAAPVTAQSIVGKAYAFVVKKYQSEFEQNLETMKPIVAAAVKTMVDRNATPIERGGLIKEINHNYKFHGGEFILSGEWMPTDTATPVTDPNLDDLPF